MKEKEEVFNNINIEEAVKEIHKHRAKILEDFARAYLAETKLMPSEIELACREVTTGTIVEVVYEFRKKT